MSQALTLNLRSDTVQLHLLQLSMLMIPVNWLLGTTLFWFLAVGMILALSFIRFSAPEWILILLGTALCLSLGVASLTDFKADRAMSAIYNVGILGLMVLFMNWGRRTTCLHADFQRSLHNRIYSAAFYCFVVQMLVILGTIFYTKVTGQKTLVFSALILGSFGKLHGIFDLYANNTLSNIDWISGKPAWRIHGLGAYATEGALLFVVTALLGQIYLQRINRLWALLAVELSLLPVLIAMGSRTTALAYAISLAMITVLWRRSFLLLCIFMVPLTLISIILFGQDLYQLTGELLQSLADARAGSTETRLLTYTLAIEMVLDTNILTGLGIKPLHDALPGVPVGSHSSFVSQFTKGGLLALSIFIWFYLLLFCRLAMTLVRLLSGADIDDGGRKFELVCLTRCVFIFLMWWITEDLDAPAYAAMLAGLIIGLFWSLSERLQYPSQNLHWSGAA